MSQGDRRSQGADDICGVVKRLDRDVRNEPLFRRYGRWLYQSSHQINTQNIRRALACASDLERVVDLGCADGQNTREILEGFPCAEIVGVEAHEPSRLRALARGINAVNDDLNGPLPFDACTFNAAISNQVLEHLSDTDMFLSEIRRVVKPGGLAIISTENMASWHNIAALLAGWQPFSSINFSTKVYPLGNPLSVHGDGGEVPTHDGMTHRRIFAYRGLRDLVSAHGFHVMSVTGSGYHPLPPGLGRLDPRHAHFISITARKR